MISLRCQLTNPSFVMQCIFQAISDKRDNAEVRRWPIWGRFKSIWKSFKLLLTKCNTYENNSSFRRSSAQLIGGVLFLLPSRFSQYLKNIQKTSSIQDFRCSSVNSSQVHTSLYSRMVHLCKPCGQYKANLHYNWQSAGWVFGRVQLTIQWDENSQDLLHNLQLPLNGSSFNAVIHRDEWRAHSEFMEDIWNLKDLISAHHLRANFWRGSSALIEPIDRMEPTNQQQHLAEFLKFFQSIENHCFFLNKLFPDFI